MAERASIFQGVQIGVEATATPGTAVAALKRLSALGISPAVKAEINTFRPMGSKFATLAVLGKEWSESKLEGVLTYTEIIYALASVLKKVSPTGGGNAKTWTMSPANNQADSYATYTVEQGGSIRAHRLAGGFIPALEIAFSRGECKVTGTMLGEALDDDIAMSGNALYTLTANASPPTAGNFTLTKGGQTTTNIAHNASPATVQAALEALSTIGTGNVKVYLKTLGPTLAVANSVYQIEFINDLGGQTITLTGTFTSLTASGSVALASFLAGASITDVDLIPVLPTEVSVYLEDTAAALSGADPLERVLSGSWAISDRYAALWALNADNSSYAATVEKEPKLMCKLKMEADAAGMALLATMRTGDSKFLRFEGVGAAISGGGNLTMRLDTAVKVANVSEFSDEDGVFAIEWEFVAVYDSTWGKATEAVVINEIGAL